MKNWLIAALITLSLAPFSVAAENCQLGGITIDTDFEMARAEGCRQNLEGVIQLELRPENTPINPSPWYAFLLKADTPRNIIIELHYAASRHRYWPKISSDGENWQRLAPERVNVSADGRILRLNVVAGSYPLWIAAQEIIDTNDNKIWLNNLSTRSDITRTELARSAENRPIEMIETDQGMPRPASILLLGRQHPPEISGAIAMQHFMNEILGDSALAQTFRQRYRVVAIPLLNPDGVAHGHWRHNAQGVDTNRDWGPFEQTETKAVHALTQSLTADGRGRLALMIDFHSTRRDVFYTQRDEDQTIIPNFTALWLERIQSYMPDYAVRRSPSHDPTFPSAKTYHYVAYQIPSITMELGDETHRPLVEKLARQSAIAMMEVLLEAGEWWSPRE